MTDLDAFDHIDVFIPPKMLKLTPVFLALIAANVSCAVSDPFPASIDPVVGDYRGFRSNSDGSTEEIFAQVSHKGNGFQARVVRTLDERTEPEVIMLGEVERGVVRFPQALGRGTRNVIRPTSQGVLIAASLWAGALKKDGSAFDGDFVGFWNGNYEMQPMHNERYRAATLGAPPPEGAVVLFSGELTDIWKTPRGEPLPWKVIDGNLQVDGRGDAVSEEVFGDHRVHVEFRSPYMPNEEGQKRGNSGVYLHGRYEIQILDSHGLEGETNECGGIYQIAKPRVNMCAPATVWQSYDIDFTAPRFGEDGKKAANARVTVWHNGVLIHEDLELPYVTGGALGQGEVSEGPLRLQNHNDPVQFRNVWVVRK